MKMTTWAVLGSLAINVMLALVIAAVFSVAPSAQAAQAAESQDCAAMHAAAHSKQPPARPAPAPSSSRGGYVVAARMGWAMG
jgi:hypothetical protein